MGSRRPSSFVRYIFWVAAFLCFAAAPARGQIQFAVTYSDLTITPAFGFADTTVVNSTTLGQLRQDCTTQATAYLSSILDGRGTVRMNWNQSDNLPASGTLASFGSGGYTGINGTFQSGAVYQRARTDTGPFSLTSDGSGKVNFGRTDWHYGVAGTNTSLSTGIDLISVMIHEFGHALGFNDLSGPDGKGISNRTLGLTDGYSTYDKLLQQGNTVGAGKMFFTDVTQSTFGSYNTSVPTTVYTGGNTHTGSNSSFTNVTTTGLYFGGALAVEVFGGPIPLYSPTTYVSGSSTAHVNVGPGTGYGVGAIGLMNTSIGTNTVRRFQPYEIAMLMDLGWNVYNWNSTSGNFLDGVSNLAQSRWRTDSGIILSTTQSTRYNMNSNQGEAPVLPVYGQSTANIVLNFRGSGVQNYTATNDIGSVRVARLILDSSSSNAITITGGTLNFGLNNDASPSILIPKILQKNSGEFVLDSALRTNDIITQIITGVTFTGNSAFRIEGPGTGQVTISGIISGSGGIVMNGGFTTVVSGANSYGGSTTINAGVFAINGDHTSATGPVAVNGGKLTGTGIIASTVTVASGGTLEAGTAIGTLTINANTTINSGGILRAEIASAGSSDRIVMNGSSYILDLRNGAVVNPQANGFNRNISSFMIADLAGSGTSLLALNGIGVPAGATITTFSSTGGNAGTTTNNFGNVGITLTGFTLTYGDSFVLSRDSSGDLALAFTPVPEPITILSFGALGLLAFRRLRLLRR